MNAYQFRKYGSQAVEWIAHYLADARGYLVQTHAKPGDIADAPPARVRGGRRKPAGSGALALGIVGALLFLFLLANSAVLFAVQIAGLFRLNEIGYGDSYILYDVMHFQRTGLIYRDLSQPPYLPAQYSPLVYRMFAVPGMNMSENPFLGPRLIALASFLLCIAIIVSIVREVVPARSAWLWGLLIAASIRPMEDWALQLRGDFAAIFFALAAIRLLLTRWRYAAVAAGVCAGLATQFKFIYLAALIAGTLWLLLRGKWRDCALFVFAGAIGSAGLYLFFWVREPGMLQQVLAVSPGVRDVLGCLKLIPEAMHTPVVLLALAALPAIARWRWPRWMLLLLFASISLGIGAVADIQAGGNVNYFFEGLFALVPFAALGTLHLLAWSHRSNGLAAFLAGLIVIELFLPQAKTDLYERITPREVVADNALFRRTAAALQGQHIFSTIPRMSLLDPRPALVEPFLLSYLHLLGKADMRPVLERVRAAEFDIAITADHDTVWRGIPVIDPHLREAITSAYRPYCVISHHIFYLPRSHSENSALVRQLDQIGCTPYPPAPSFP